LTRHAAGRVAVPQRAARPSPVTRRRSRHMDDEPAASALSVQGSVVEVLERGTVVEVSSPPADVTLGDRVVVDASLRIERVREREHADDGVDARQRTDDAGATTP